MAGVFFDCFLFFHMISFYQNISNNYEGKKFEGEKQKEVFLEQNRNVSDIIVA